VKKSIILIIALCLLNSLLYADEIFRLKSGKIYSGTICSTNKETITIITEVGNMIGIPREQILVDHSPVRETESLDVSSRVYNQEQPKKQEVLVENKAIENEKSTFEISNVGLDHIELKNGLSFRGEIVDFTSDTVSIKNDIGEIIGVNRSDIVLNDKQKELMDTNINKQIIYLKKIINKNDAFCSSNFSKISSAGQDLYTARNFQIAGIVCSVIGTALVYSNPTAGIVLSVCGLICSITSIVFDVNGASSLRDVQH